MHGEGKHFSRGALSFWQALIVFQFLRIVALLMHWDGIINPATNLLLLEMLDERIASAIWHPDCVLVIDMLIAFENDGNGDAAQMFAEKCGVTLPGAVEALQLFELLQTD